MGNVSWKFRRFSRFYFHEKSTAFDDLVGVRVGVKLSQEDEPEGIIIRPEYKTRTRSSEASRREEQDPRKSGDGRIHVKIRKFTARIHLKRQRLIIYIYFLIIS